MEDSCLYQEKDILCRMNEYRSENILERMHENGYPEGARRMIGVGYMQLRALAQEYAGSPEWYKVVDEELSDDTYEEVLLQALITGMACKDKKEIFSRFRKIVAKVDTIQLCDGVCLAFRPAICYPDDTLPFLKEMLNSKKEWEQRFALVVLLDYYVNSDHVEDVLNYLSKVNPKENVPGEAWYWAWLTCFLAFPCKTLNQLEKPAYNQDVVKKILDYFKESPRLDDVRKNMIEEFKIRNS